MKTCICTKEPDTVNNETHVSLDTFEIKKIVVFYCLMYLYQQNTTFIILIVNGKEQKLNDGYYYIKVNN